MKKLIQLGLMVILILPMILTYSPEEKANAASAFTWPLENHILTSGFQTPSRPTHNGIDLDVAGSGYQYNVPVYASASGTVTRSAVSSSYGEVVYIQHSINGVTYETRYAHMHPSSRTVSKGDTVRQGQRLGYMGTTGDSTGQHLHFEILRGSVPVNPLDYLNGNPPPPPSDPELDWDIEKPSDENYYRVKTGYFDSTERLEDSLALYDSKYPFPIYASADEATLAKEDEWKLRIYTAQLPGKNNAEKFKENLEELFPWQFHIVDANEYKPFESLDYTLGGNSETAKYRVMTGYFNNLEDYNDARDQFEADYSNVIYGANDDSSLHKDGDLNLRFVTGQVTGISAAEDLKASLESKFPWNFHIVEAYIPTK